MSDAQPEDKSLGQYDIPEDLVNADLTGRDLRGDSRSSSRRRGPDRRVSRLIA